MFINTCNMLNGQKNAKRFFHPHFMWVAFRYDKGNHYFVKFDWDSWGDNFYKKHGWYLIDDDTKFEIQGEEKYDGVKLFWIPIGFKLFMYI